MSCQEASVVSVRLWMVFVVPMASASTPPGSAGCQSSTRTAQFGTTGAAGTLVTWAETELPLSRTAW
jgi:hypothetical protein